MNSALFIDFVILVTLLEWPLLLWLTRGARADGLLRSFAPVPLMLMLLPGFFLLVAARVVSTDSFEPLVLIFLALAGITHVLDLSRRYQQESR